LVRLREVAMQEPTWISSSLARLVSWDQQQAKAKFAEVVRRARSEGPQLVTTRGTRPVVIMSAEDFVALTENRPKSFRDLLLPGGDEDFEPRRLSVPAKARRVRL
jgi:antitoxin Phd